MALGFCPLSYESGVMIMTDFEIISVVIMIFMLVFAALSYNKPGK